MWQRFTESARKIVFYAQVAADERGRTNVAAEHFLLGLLREVREEKSVWPPAPTDRVDPHNMAASLLRNVDVDKLRAAADQQITRLALPTSKTPKDVDLLPSGKRVIDAAFGEVQKLSAENITPEFLLLGMFGPETGGTALLLTEAGLDWETARREVASVYQPAQENKAKDGYPTFWSRLFAKHTHAPGEKEIR